MWVIWWMKSPKERPLGVDHSTRWRMVRNALWKFPFCSYTRESCVFSRTLRISLTGSPLLCPFLFLGQLLLPAGSLFLERLIFIVLFVFSSLMNCFMTWIQITGLLWRKAKGQGGRAGRKSVRERDTPAWKGCLLQSYTDFSSLSDNLLTLSYLQLIAITSVC